VLVTGAAGFIGRHLCSALLSQEATVIGCLRPGSKFSSPQNKQFSVQEVDVSSRSEVMRLIRDTRPDVVFNLASSRGNAGGPEALSTHAASTFGGALNVALSVLESGTPLMVQIGSSEEYGDGSVPFREDQALRPVSPYSAAKAAASEFLDVAFTNFQLPVILVRPTVVYGPGQMNAMLIPQLFINYLSGRAPRLTPAEQTRDFIFVEDVVAALSKFGQRTDLAGEVFNIASGIEHKVHDVAQAVADICRYSGDLGIGQLPYRNPEVMHHCGSIEKTLAALNWQPETSLDEGLRRTYESFKPGTINSPVA
jgi:UDP-glucose 4-epimerase